MIFKIFVVYLFLSKYVNLIITDVSVYICLSQFAYTETDEGISKHERFRHIRIWKFK